MSVEQLHHKIILPELYAFQNDILQALNAGKSVYAVISRQAGKTEVARQAAIERALDGKKVMWISPVYKESEHVWLSCKNTLGPLVRRSEKGHEIDLYTGGSISFRSSDAADTIRGPNFSLIISDEHCFGPANLWPVIEPMTKRQNGEHLLISTPCGHNHGWTLWQTLHDKPNWVCLQLPWTCCPDLTEAKIRESEGYMTPARFRQEYMASFESPEGAIFPAQWLNPRDKIFVSQMPDSPQRTMIGIDPSTGHDLKKGDYQAVAIIFWKDGTVYVDMHAGRWAVHDMCVRVAALYNACPVEGIALETNGFQILIETELKRHFVTQPRIYPVVNASVSKLDRISRLGHWLAREQFKILDNEGGNLLYNQLQDFGSPTLEHDDCMDAVEIGIRTLTET